MPKLVKTLSSSQTFMMKIILPIIWFAITLILLISDLRDWLDDPVQEIMFFKSSDWFFLLAWLMGSIFIMRSTLMLKRVRIDSYHLYVSNYIREIKIPLNHIMSVTENRWDNIHPVTIFVCAATEFGQTITFMPKVRFLNYRPHPVVNELLSINGLIPTK